MTDTTTTPTYCDPHPGRKGTDRVHEQCGRCDGQGSVSWGVDVSGAVHQTDQDGNVVGTRSVSKVCFSCRGVGSKSILVSSVRARVRAQIKQAKQDIEDAAKFIAEREAREAEEAANAAQWATDHAGQIEFLNSLKGDFAISLRSDLEHNGKLTDKQIATLDQIAAEKANEPEATPVLEGRMTVTGTIKSFKSTEGYGYYSAPVWKMVVLDDRGFKVYGSVPASLADAEKGDRITFTATLTPSPDDETFGWFKRPTKATIITN